MSGRLKEGPDNEGGDEGLGGGLLCDITVAGLTRLHCRHTTPFCIVYSAALPAVIIDVCMLFEKRRV